MDRKGSIDSGFEELKEQVNTTGTYLGVEELSC